MSANPNPPPRYIEVQNSVQISPHMQRIYFSSEDFSDFPSDQNGAHIKLFFPEDEQSRPLLPYRNESGKIVWPEGKRPVIRTYTIRDFLEKEQLLVVDFVRHEDFGVAAHWATHAQQGDVIGLAGPGGPHRFNASADYFVMIGDLSSLPVIAASLEQLQTSDRGEIWIEVDSLADVQDITFPPGFSIHWISPEQDAETLIAHSFEQLNWAQHNISVTLAGENSRVVALRKLLRTQHSMDRKNLYAVPYWRRGHTEESYHEERHRVMDDEG